MKHFKNQNLIYKLDIQYQLMALKQPFRAKVFK